MSGNDNVIHTVKLVIAVTSNIILVAAYTETHNMPTQPHIRNGVLHSLIMQITIITIVNNSVMVIKVKVLCHIHTKIMS